MNWTTIENAIHAWVVSASGVAAASVLWARYASSRPSGQWISLSIPDVTKQGQDWTKIEDTDGEPEGEEITHKVQGPRTITLSIQCFAGVPTTASAPRAVLSNVLAKAKLPTIKAALVTAGIGVAASTPILSVGAEQSSTIEPRAVTTVTLHLASEVIETGTYIEEATIEGTSPVVPAFTVTIS